jgi:2-amino-4-hydroxy-6-hydroxymethyldihydropteridine diphosphokinase
MNAIRAYIGLGSNLDNPLQQVRAALDELTRLPATRLVGHSRLYRSAPLGPAGQPDYINAVAALDTELAPHALLDALQAIEQAHGRERSLHWGPRTLDLDLLLYGDEVFSTARLTVPHPEMARRNFVLIPLAELAPGQTLPDGRVVQDLALACGDAGLARVDEDASAP